MLVNIIKNKLYLNLSIKILDIEKFFSILIILEYIKLPSKILPLSLSLFIEIIFILGKIFLLIVSIRFFSLSKYFRLKILLLLSLELIILFVSFVKLKIIKFEDIG